jgi:hypothetical protein
MSKIVELLSFIPKGGIVQRDFDERAAELALSVKDFGAKGDDSTDDTAAIMACFTAAFGSYASPHGGYGSIPGPIANKEVYFPAGRYKVSSSYTQPILGVTDSGAVTYGYTNPLIQVASTAGLQTGDMIYIRGTASPFGLLSVNGSYGIDVVDSTHFILKYAQFVSAFGAGGTATTPCLKIRAVQGGHIFGAGRLTTELVSTTPNCCLISLNAWGFSRMDSMALSGPTGGVGLDYNWVQRAGDTVSSQSNTFYDMQISGGDYGALVGHGQAMCSETTWLNCYFTGSTGLRISNYNALQHGFIGGNFGSCNVYGIYCAAGSCPAIFNVGFQNYQFPATFLADIYIENSAEDSYAIIGCRTESSKFFACGPALPYNIIGCAQLDADTPGNFFYSGPGPANLIGCTSLHGVVQGGGGSSLNVQGCRFSRADWNQWYGPSDPQFERPYFYPFTTDVTGTPIRVCGTIWANTGATGPLQFNLPWDNTEISPGVIDKRLPPGARISFLVTTAQFLKAQATSAVRIRDGATLSALGGFIRSTAVGSFIELMAIDNGGFNWIVTSKQELDG